MNCLITGVNGFVGQYLSKELKNYDYSILGCDTHSRNNNQCIDKYLKCDIVKTDQVEKIFQKNNIKSCIHLAAISFVPRSWQKNDETINVNIHGTNNILEAIRKYSPECRLLYISSIEVYGKTLRMKKSIDEKSPLMPQSPYALSKMYSEILLSLYYEKYNLDYVIARPSNHIGPNQSPDFVVPSFVNQCIKIQNGTMPPEIKVGNIKTERDFTDVRDVVIAYRKLLKSGKSGDIFNVARGKNIAISEILKYIFQITGIEPKTTIDDNLFRIEDPPGMVNTNKIQEQIGWTPKLSVKNSLLDIVKQGS